MTTSGSRPTDKTGMSTDSTTTPNGVELARDALDELVRRQPERHPLVIGLVAAVGTSLDTVVHAMRNSFMRFSYQLEVVHLSKLLDDDLPYKPWGTLPERDESSYYERRMDAGDQLRREVGNDAALAALAVGRVSSLREEAALSTVYILRSLKHPDEEALLRQVYGDAFSLVGVYSPSEERRESLADGLSLFENPRGKAEELIARDESDSDQPSGQHVRDVYSRADAYLPLLRGFDPIPEVDRFVDSLFGAPFLTPRFEEEAMRLAYDASLRSAAVGRQVGAALIPTIGTPVVVGTNEVPKPGGGQYWTSDSPDYRDFQTGIDPNPVYTRRVIQEVLERLARRGWLIAMNYVR